MFLLHSMSLGIGTVFCCDIVWNRLHSAGTHLDVLGCQDGVMGQWVLHSWNRRLGKVLGRLRMSRRCR